MESIHAHRIAYEMRHYPCHPRISTAVPMRFADTYAVRCNLPVRLEHLCRRAAQHEYSTYVTDESEWEEIKALLPNPLAVDWPGDPEGRLQRCRKAPLAVVGHEAIFNPRASVRAWRVSAIIGGLSGGGTEQLFADWPAARQFARDKRCNGSEIYIYRYLALPARLALEACGAPWHLESEYDGVYAVLSGCRMRIERGMIFQSLKRL